MLGGGGSFRKVRAARPLCLAQIKIAVSRSRFIRDLGIKSLSLDLVHGVTRSENGGSVR